MKIVVKKDLDAHKREYGYLRVKKGSGIISFFSTYNATATFFPCAIFYLTGRIEIKMKRKNENQNSI
jgi:hypothetical protein